MNPELVATEPMTDESALTDASPATQASPVRDASPVTDVSSGAEPASAPGRGHRLLYLSGRPSLRDFIKYVRRHAVEQVPERDITESWKRSADVVFRLEQTEAGRADDARTSRFGAEYDGLVAELLADQFVRNNFNSVPTDIALVELDKLVVYQKHIDLGFAGKLAHRVEASLDPATVFRMCLPFDHPTPPVKWSRVHGNTFVFVSPSNDLRSFGAVRLDPSHLGQVPMSGPLVGIAGVAVGFGSNFLNAISCEGRIILNNGSHRAYALRSMGMTHAPCIVQHASSREELKLVASSAVTQKADLFLKHPRPPMLCDYFDPRLHVELESVPRMTQVRVTVEVDENWMPAL